MLPNFFVFFRGASADLQGVQIGPGATPLTRMSFGPNCFASDLA